MILVDTAVWISHFRQRSSRLVDLLDAGEVLTHPFLLGELACGHLQNRRDVLRLMGALPAAVVATHDEVLLFIEERRLMGKGIGYVDVHLLASASLTDRASLWTDDRRLAAVAREMRLGH